MHPCTGAHGGGIGTAMARLARVVQLTRNVCLVIRAFQTLKPLRTSCTVRHVNSQSQQGAEGAWLQAAISLGRGRAWNILRLARRRTLPTQ